MTMERNDIHRHCPEVEDLMGVKMPFVTRYGITLTVGVLPVVGIALFFFLRRTLVVGDRNVLALQYTGYCLSSLLIPSD